MLSWRVYQTFQYICACSSQTIFIFIFKENILQIKFINFSKETFILNNICICLGPLESLIHNVFDTHKTLIGHYNWSLMQTYKTWNFNENKHNSIKKIYIYFLIYLGIIIINIFIIHIHGTRAMTTIYIIFHRIWYLQKYSYSY